MMRFFIEGEDPTMQFIHEDDVARACMMCIEQKTRGVYNLVGKGTVKLSEIWEEIGGTLPPIKIPAWFIYPAVNLLWEMGVLFEAPAGQLDFMRWPWWASGEKMKKEVGFEAKYTSKETVKIFLQARKAK